MRTKLFAVMAVAALALLAPSASIADEHGEHPILYGGTGGVGSPQDGSLIIIDQQTAAVTFVGKPAGVARIAGLAFDEDGKLWGSTQTAGPPPHYSNLIRIDPETGALVFSVPITDGPGGPPIAISDLAVQPETNRLFGVRAPVDHLGGAGNLYKINKKTGVATFVCTGPARFASIAFAKNGALYLATAPLEPATFIYTLDPTNCAIIRTIPTANPYASLAVRPTDGLIWGGDGDGGNIFKIDPTTGAETLVGNTSPYLVGDLAFRTNGENDHEQDGHDD
jgi:outer membrane protein assembly factor BamB